MSGETAKLACGGCGKNFLSKPEYAGKAFKCRCGAIIRVPAAPAAAGRSQTRSAQARPTAQAQPLAQVRPAAQAKPTAHARPTAQSTGRPATSRPKPVSVPRPAPPPKLAPAIAVDADPFAALVAQAEEYTLSDEARAEAAARAPAAKVAAAVAKPTSPLLAYARPQRAVAQQDVQDANVKNIYVPLALLVAGIVAYFIDAALHGFTNPVFITAFVGFHVVVNLVLVFIALMIGVKLLNLGLGEVGPALLKIAAVALLPGAIGNIIAFKIMATVSWGVTVLMYWGLMAYLFELDLQEMSIITAIIWVIQTWVGIILIGVLFNVIGVSTPSPLGGVGPGSSTTSGLRSPGGSSAGSSGVGIGISREDQAAAARVRNGLPDAREFLSPDNLKNQSVRPKEEVLAMVNRLYNAGARHVWIGETETTGDVTKATTLLLEMPRSADARKVVLNVVDQLTNSTDASAGDDDLYLTVPLE